MQDVKHQLRRKFIQQASMAGSGVLLPNPLQLFSQTNKTYNMSKNINSKGYAGKDEKKKNRFPGISNVDQLETTIF